MELCNRNNLGFSLLCTVCPSTAGKKNRFVNYHGSSHTEPLNLTDRPSGSHYLSVWHQYNFKVISQFGSFCRSCFPNVQMPASLHLAQNSPPTIHLQRSPSMKSLPSKLPSCVRSYLHFLLTRMRVLFIFQLVDEPALNIHFTACFVEPLLAPLLLVQVLWEADAKMRLNMQGFC